MTSAKSSSKGFTLIELLVVVAIIAALAVTVFVALNPAQRLADANDARRVTDADSILTAIHTYIVDNKGAYPSGLASPTTEVQLGTGLAGVCSPVTSGGCSVAASTACLNLATPLANYLKSMPIDPIGGTTYDATKTGYTVAVDANGIVTVKACGTQGTTNISVSR